MCGHPFNSIIPSVLSLTLRSPDLDRSLVSIGTALSLGVLERSEQPARRQARGDDQRVSLGRPRPRRGDGELMLYVLRAMPDCLWPAAFISSGVYAHSSSPAQSHRICLSRCNRCGDVNFAWEHEPEPSSHETTTSLSRTCARRVFVKMTAHRRLRNNRCACPKGVKLSLMLMGRSRF